MKMSTETEKLFSALTMKGFAGIARTFGTRRIDTKNIVRTFANKEEALEFYESNTDLPVGQLEPVLSQLAYLQSFQKIPADELFGDERFVRLLLQVSSDIENCESAKLVRLAQSLSSLSLPRGGCGEVTDLARRVGEMTATRPNAFSPSDLSGLTFGLASRGYADPVFVDFIRMETMKMVQDFTPANAIMMLEACRRMNVFNRELVDNLVERLTDEADRFTSKDISNCVTVFAKLGLGRGFLLRRLSKLSYENLNLFSQIQLVRLLTGFAKLRFTTSAGIDELLVAISSRGLSKLPPNLAAESLFAVALSNYKGESMVLDRLVDHCSGHIDTLPVSSLVDLAWSLAVLDRTGKFTQLFESVAGNVFSSNSPPANKNVLLKALEIAPSVDADAVSAQWKSAMDDAEKLETGRFESARLHSEMLALIESIKPAGMIKEKLAIQRNFQAGGLFRVDFFDQNHQLAIDIDTLSRPTTLGLRHRILAEQGVATVSIGYWDIRRLKTFDEQQELLKSLIGKALRSRG
jgi:hypothetical protein